MPVARRPPETRNMILPALIMPALAGLALAVANPATPAKPAADADSVLTPGSLVLKAPNGDSRSTFPRVLPPEQTFQMQINPKLPPCQFQVIADKEGRYVERVEVTWPSDPKRRPQTLTPVGQGPVEGYEYFTVADIDGDGFLDLRMWLWSGATGNVGWMHWLFDSKAGRFVYRADLDEFDWNERKPGMINRHYTGGCGEGYHNKYTFVNGIPVRLFGQECQSDITILYRRDPATNDDIEITCRDKECTYYRDFTGWPMVDDVQPQPATEDILREVRRKWFPEDRTYLESTYERRDGKLLLVRQRVVPADVGRKSVPQEK
jgi:hypothetical protein